MLQKACAALIASVALGGCVLPFASPPLEVVGDLGARKRDAGALSAAAGGTLSARPLAAFDALHARPVDFGVGVRAEHGGRYGPAADVRGYFVDRAFESGARARAAAGFEGRALHEDGVGWGMAGAMRVLGEYMIPQRGACGSSSSSKGFIGGCAAGEWALGGLVETSYGVLAGTPVRAVNVGVTVRLPALAGLFIAAK